MFSTGADIGLEAWVENRDTEERLNEYQVEELDATEGGRPARSECYLETIDQPYAIRIRKLPSLKYRGDSICEVSIDGVMLPNPIWLKKEKSLCYSGIMETHNGKTYWSSFNFALLSTTDEVENITLTEEDNKSLGIIHIRIVSGSLTKSRPCPEDLVRFEAKIGDERAKKFAHSTRLSREEECSHEHNPTPRFTFTEGKQPKVLYEFEFRYHSTVKLQQLKIIATPDMVDVEQKEREHSSSAIASSSKKKLSTSSFVDVIDLRDTPAPSSEQKGKKRRRFRDAIELEVEDEKPEILSNPSRENLMRRIKLLEEENQGLRKNNRRLEIGQKIKTEALDLTNDTDEDE